MQCYYPIGIIVGSIRGGASLGAEDKKYRLQDLVDVGLLNSLSKTFFEATGLSSAIMDTNGLLLVHAGWKPICANFYRKNPETRKLCVQSDAYMAKHVAHTDSYILYKCENGLIDAAVPIIVAGNHLASIYHGQLLFDQPDLAFFRGQARRYDFPEAAFMQAVNKIPIYSKEKFETVINYFITIAKFIARLADANLALLQKRQNEANNLGAAAVGSTIFPGVKNIAATKPGGPELDLLEVYHDLELRSDFINDLAAGKFYGDPWAKIQAARLGIDIDSDLYGITIVCGKIDAALVENPLPAARQLRIKLLIALMEMPDVLVWHSQEGVSLLCIPQPKAKRNEPEIVEFVREKLTDIGCVPAFVGISDKHRGLDGIGKISRQAASAAAAARYMGNSQSVNILNYRDAGIFQVITGNLQIVDSQDFIQTNIGPVIEYDRQNGTNFLQTLEELLSTASIKEIAEKLYLHPKTVIFRRQRIEKILGIDLDAVEIRLALGVAIRLYKIKKYNSDHKG